MDRKNNTAPYQITQVSDMFICGTVRISEVPGNVMVMRVLYLIEIKAGESEELMNILPREEYVPKVYLKKQKRKFRGRSE